MDYSSSVESLVKEEPLDWYEEDLGLVKEEPFGLEYEEDLGLVKQEPLGLEYEEDLESTTVRKLEPLSPPPTELGAVKEEPPLNIPYEGELGSAIAVEWEPIPSTSGICLLVGNPALISVPVTQSYMIATSQKEPAKAVAVPSNESSQPRPRMKVSKGTALTLKVCTADGFLTWVKISEAMEQELDLNSLVHEAITQVYSINMDLDAILEEEIINSEEIQPRGHVALAD